MFILFNLLYNLYTFYLKVYWKHVTAPSKITISGKMFSAFVGKQPLHGKHSQGNVLKKNNFEISGFASETKKYHLLYMS